MSRVLPERWTIAAYRWTPRRWCASIRRSGEGCIGGYERERLWRELRFAPLAPDDPQIERLIAMLRAMDADGGVVFTYGAAKNREDFARTFERDRRSGQFRDELMSYG